MRTNRFVGVLLVCIGLSLEAGSQFSGLPVAESGDTQVLQGIFCEVEEVAGIDPFVQQELQCIGGGFSVLTLATLFDRDSDYDRIVKEKKLWRPGDDFVLAPLRRCSSHLE